MDVIVGTRTQAKLSLFSHDTLFHPALSSPLYSHSLLSFTPAVQFSFSGCSILLIFALRILIHTPLSLLLALFTRAVPYSFIPTVPYSFIPAVPYSFIPTVPYSLSLLSSSPYPCLSSSQYPYCSVHVAGMFKCVLHVELPFPHLLLACSYVCSATPSARMFVRKPMV